MVEQEHENSIVWLVKKSRKLSRLQRGKKRKPLFSLFRIGNLPRFFWPSKWSNFCVVVAPLCCKLHLVFFTYFLFQFFKFSIFCCTFFHFLSLNRFSENLSSFLDILTCFLIKWSGLPIGFRFSNSKFRIWILFGFRTASCSCAYEKEEICMISLSLYLHSTLPYKNK